MDCVRDPSDVSTGTGSWCGGRRTKYPYLAERRIRRIGFYRSCVRGAESADPLKPNENPTVREASQRRQFWQRQSKRGACNGKQGVSGVVGLWEAPELCSIRLCKNAVQRARVTVRPWPRRPEWRSVAYNGGALSEPRVKPKFAQRGIACTPPQNLWTLTNAENISRCHAARNSSPKLRASTRVPLPCSFAAVPKGKKKKTQTDRPRQRIIGRYESCGGSFHKALLCVVPILMTTGCVGSRTVRIPARRLSYTRRRKTLA